MLLLDSALGYSDGEVLAEVSIRPDHPLAQPEGVPVHVGIELMAQTCGAHVGALALATGQSVKVGFLLGTRRYEAAEDWLRVGDRVRIHAQVVFMEDSMGVYDCRLERDGTVLARAQLNLYQPESAASALATMRGKHD